MTIKSYKINGKYQVGLPGSTSWKSKTPWKLKVTGEVVILTANIMNVIVAQYNIPVIIIIGSCLTLAGRFLIKMFGTRN